MGSDKIILFDMDNTLVNYESQLLYDYQMLLSPEEKEKFNPKDIFWLDSNDYPHIKNRIRLIKSVPGWWENLPKNKIGFKILEMALEIGFNVHILTKGPYSNPTAWAEKLKWCRKNLVYAKAKVTITESDKSLVYGRILVDDYVPFMKSWLEHRPRGIGLMPHCWYNENYIHDRVLKCDKINLALIKHVLLNAYNRK
jgi:5'(3')-deoxyribonucleotidase